MSLEAVIGAFASQVAELREATLLRVDESAKDLYSQDLETIEATVRALEIKLRDIRSYVKKEKDAIPKALAVVEACKLQRQHLEHIAGNLPTYLPSLQSPTSSSPPPAAVLQENRGNNAHSNHIESMKAGNDLSRYTTASAAAAEPKKKSSSSNAAAPLTAVRRYITQDEFDSISPYMRGRLTTEKVNAALDELISRAETTATLVSNARRNRPLGNDRKHAQWLLYNLAPFEALKGKVWTMEADLKSGAALRLDNTGKTILTLLRHLGRVAELRINADGATHLVYAVL
ncbi:hypothetical protein Ndes2526B_g01813 [Nannochloris sp. 'desiccata']|nr:hypothetical protein KSW81_005709 [Chlorella desiccata (nom. nud.)]KAH7623382.1 putative Spindle and kinetochore-associated protein 1-like protein [Chlorella desiccata (nom. nud.)]